MCIDTSFAATNELLLYYCRKSMCKSMNFNAYRFESLTFSTLILKLKNRNERNVHYNKELHLERKFNRHTFSAVEICVHSGFTW